jgi:hypothetical protein
MTAMSLRSQNMGLDGRPNPGTVLLGWELGGGFGHVQRLGALAQGLAERGLRPVLAVKDLAMAGTFLRSWPFPVVQAPLRHLRTEGANFLAASYADVLAVRGFASADELWPLVQAWQGLLDLVRPALVVCDQSPALCLAAYGLVPAVNLGAAFGLPPADGAAFPRLVPGRKLLVPEEQLLAAVREVQRRRRLPAPDTLPGLLAGGPRFLTFLPQLDPYRALRPEPHLGPLGYSLGPPLPPPARPAFFAYLNADAPSTGPLVAALARAGRPGTAYLRGAAPEMRERLRRQGVEVLESPVPVEEVLPRAAVVVHHGGAGLAEQALAAGRPQLLVPEHLEHVLNAQLIDGLGAGLYLAGRFPPEAAAEELGRLLGEPRFTAQAQAAARTIQAGGPWAPLEGIVESCLALARQGPLSVSAS